MHEATIRMRISKDKILQRRTDRESIFFITGGTGFIGSHLTVELLKKGLKVFLLARSSKGMSARQRVDQMLDWFDLEPGYREGVEVFEGTLDTPHFGLDKKDFCRLLRDVDEIIHCASNTSFLERKRAAVERTNIGGTRNVLDLAADGRCYFFHHVSTAYAVGRRTGICREELADNVAFTNIYEETKYRAERMASERCRGKGIRLSVYRPSVVYGNSKTGRSTKFSAVYYPVKTVLFLKNLYETDIRERGGDMAREMGVRFTGDGSLYLPIRVEVANGGGVNLIPVDYFVNAFMSIMGEYLDGGIFHIVNQELKRVEDIVDYTKRLFKVDGMESCPAESFDEKSKNALEILFDAYLEIYGPYMRDTRIFDNRKAQAILLKEGVVCPDFDFEIFSRCMNFAVECGWGAKR
jgi:nucleoside-diphosphate-sugar epimerase